MQKTEAIKKSTIPPALTALLVQICALLLNLMSSIAFQIVTGKQTDILILILIQSVLSTALAYAIKMPTWWRYIHFGFPIAILFLSSFHIASHFYLVGFIFSASLFWSTYRTQVPFYPSRPIIWQQVSALLPKDKTVKLIDIGSGLGDLSLSIAQTRPDCLIYGIEIAPLPWLISYLRSKLTRSSAKFLMGDYERLNFADYDIIFAYLSPAAMPALWHKASTELRPGALLISYEFPIQDIKPQQTITHKNSKAKLYVYTK